MRAIGGSFLVHGLLLGALACADGAAAQELPPGVTPAMVDRGRQVYVQARLCSGCHGPRGTGVPGLGPDLTDGDWRLVDGSYRSLVERIGLGVTAERSALAIPMPPAGGARLARNEIEAVAAYVWTLAR